MDGVGIKVIGIGTVGNDVLNKMMKKEIAEVQFMGIDTNQGNLDKLNVESKILASDNLSEKVQSAFKNTDLEFITNLIKKQGVVNLDFDDIKIMLGN